MGSLGVLRWSWSLVAVIASAGCGTDDESVVEVGVISGFPMLPMIEVPAMAAAGVPFDVVVMTFGSSCVTHERTDIEAGGAGVLVTPFDRRIIPGEGEACFQAGTRIEHRVAITLDGAGVHRVIVRGRGGLEEDAPVVEQPFDVSVP